MAHDPGFEEFVHGSSRRLLRSAYLLAGGDHAAAEDLLQGAMLRVARRWSAACEAPEAYARQVLVNLSRDGQRRAGRRVVEAPWDEAVAVPGDRDQSELVAGRQVVMAALAQLPDRQREVIVLRFYADLSVAETAAATGASEGTVKSYTSRALDRMRQLLAEPAVNVVEVSHDE